LVEDVFCVAEILGCAASAYESTSFGPNMPWIAVTGVVVSGKEFAIGSNDQVIDQTDALKNL